MTRGLRSKEEIWLEIESNLLHHFEGYADPTICIPLPTLRGLPDSSGCNWCMRASSDDPRTAAFLSAAIKMVQAEFNLLAEPSRVSDWTSVSTATDLDWRQHLES
jgi:hypothetical protein